MSASKHHPTPWSFERGAYGWLVRDAGNGVVASISFEDAARLIAASPELLEALRDARETLEDYSDVRDGPDGAPRPNAAMSAITQIDAAIAKAAGETQP